jgi:hypothetical protein
MRACSSPWKRVNRLTPEALEFARDGDHTRFITGKALDIAGEFETADEQIATLKLAIKQRAAHKQLSLAHVILNWRRLCDEEHESVEAGDDVGNDN